MTNEQVKFRLFEMPCCGQLLCWVNRPSLLQEQTTTEGKLQAAHRGF